MKKLLITTFVLIFSIMSISYLSAKESKTLPKKLASEAVDMSLIAKTMGWDKAKITQRPDDFSKKFSLCTWTHADESIFLRLGWKSEKAASTKVLERQFGIYLENGEKDLKYTEVKKADNYQIIQGKGNSSDGRIVYIVRKRFGNNAELQFEYYTNKEDPKAYEKLLKFVEGV